MIRLAAVTSLAIYTLAAPAVAESFPPVTASERAVQAVAGQPGAPAVVLFSKAELKVMDLVNDFSSSLEVHGRIKILTEEGRKYGEIEVAHSDLYRLREFSGRTVLPDGRGVPLTEDRVVVERISGTRKPFVTRAAFPEVVVGAIVDYRYTLTWDEPYYLEPWYFHGRIPTTLSQIVYDVPANMAFQTWSREKRGKIRSNTVETPRGVRLRVWMKDLPAIPEEPLAFPLSDLSASFMVVPTAVTVRRTRQPILESWESVCATFERSYYGPVRSRSGEAGQAAAALAVGAADARAKAAAVYRFVRDEIRTAASRGVFVDEESSVGGVLGERRGTVAEKALLLQAMLESLGLEPRLVWVGDRTEGRIDLEVASPAWFEKMIVRVELGGVEVFLDPGDRRLGFARLSPFTEGAQALLFHERRPEEITLPRLAFHENTRRLALNLEHDEDGRLSGGGKLRLAGHHAWSRLRWKEAPAATADAWKEWLEDRFDGYHVSVHGVEESLDEQRITVSFFLSQHEEHVNFERASLEPSRPFGPVRQPFTVALDERRSSVQFPFAYRDVLTMELIWDPDWEIAAAPGPDQLNVQLGVLAVDVEVDEADHRLLYQRRFDVRRSELGGRNYAALRRLFARLDGSDAQELVIVKP